MKVTCVGNDLDTSLPATSGLLKGSFKTCLGVKTDRGDKVGQELLETNLADKGWKTGLLAFAQGDKGVDLFSGDCKKVGIKNDVGLIKEVIEIRPGVTSQALLFNNPSEKEIRMCLTLE